MYNHIKNPLFYLALVFLPGFIFSVPAQAQQTVTVSGKINNALSDTVLLEIYTVPASYTGVSYPVAISNSGDFTISAPLQEPMVAELVHGSESVVLYLQPGDNLDLRLNADDFISSVKSKGKGTNENLFMLQYVRKFQEEEDYQVLPDNIHKREKEFLQFLEERRQDQLAFLEKFSRSNPITEVFKQYALAEIEFSYANDRLTYSDVRKRVGGLKPDLSPTYYDYLNKVNLNQPGAMRNQAFLDFLKNYFQHKALSSRVGSKDNNYYPTVYNLVKQDLTGPVKDMMLSRIVDHSIRFGNAVDTDAMYLDFQQEVQQPQYLSYLKTQYQKFREIGIGNLAPDFTLLSSTGDSISLGSLKGKMVYLGFWRNACGICAVDQHAYKYFVEQLAAKGIVFLQVSVGEEKTAWEQKSKKQSMPAIQLYAPDQKAAVVQAYDVQNFPSYYLIAPDGTLVSTNARRPGHAEGAREIASIIDQYTKIMKK